MGWSEAGSGAASGAAVGSFGGPVGTIVGAGIGALGGLFGSKEQANASTQAAQIQANAVNTATQAQSAAAAQTLAFQKQQAETDYQNQEVNRRANYNQWAANSQRLGSLASQMYGLPGRNLPAYVPGVDPNYQGASQAPGSLASTANGSGQSAANMPQGIDPRFAALYQKYGVTPGPRGSGPSDWQYYQQDAVKNAGGDVNYILGRLETDLKGGGASAKPTSTAQPGSLASLAAPQSIPYATAPLYGQ